MNITELLETLANNEIAVYGTGYYAERFYMGLEKINLQHKIKCFVVTNSNESSARFMGKPVEQLDNLEGKDIYIYIAVHESIKCAIEKNLQKCNRSKYIWVTPYIDELLFGEPIAYHKNVKTADILRSQNADNFLFAVRYLVIESFYNGNDVGDNVYIKMEQYLFGGNKEIANNKLMRYKKLIKNWDEAGYQEDSDITIDEKGQFIDGKHRFTLACYHKIESVYCTIFPYTGEVSRYMKYVDRFNSKDMEEVDYTQYEVDMILSTQEKLLSFCK